MPDLTFPENRDRTAELERELAERRAENAALRHELTDMNRTLELVSRQHQLDLMPATDDPFGNPTEYKIYRDGDYTDILPELRDFGYKMPLEPDYHEKRRLKHSYAVGGACVFLRFVLADWIASLLIMLTSYLLNDMNPSADGRTLITYMKGSAILASINLITFLFVNVVTAFIGLKLAKVKFTSIIKTRDYGLANAIQYCLIAVFILLISVITSNYIEDIFSRYGTTTHVLNLEGTAVTSLGAAVMLIYRCLIAPVTEELFFRGMLLKTFSKANQRFAIFATAVFFGLAHSNIPQFVLAFLTGIFLAHITMKHGSIIPAIVVHIFVNSFSSLPDLLDLSGNSAAIYNMVFVFLAALGAVMFVAFAVVDRLPSATPYQSRRGLPLASMTFIVAAAFWAQVLYLVSFIVDSPILNTIKEWL